MLRFIRWFAIGLIVVLGVVTGTVWLRGGAEKLASAGLGISGNVEVGGPFTLTDTTGKVVTDATFRGKWMLVYFGYTFCPDVCPTELQAVAASLDQLGPLATKVVPIFITIDPERDTPGAMADYVKLFDDRLIGLTGTNAEIVAVTRAYRVYYAKSVGKDPANYLMDHSSFLYLMGPDGKLRMLLKPGTTGAEIAAAIRAKMSTS